MPGVDFAFYFVLQNVWENLGESLKLKIAVLFVYITVIGIVLVALFLAILYQPSILFYPAVCVAVCLLGLKLVAVVIHKPTLKKLSAMASSSEGNFEACYQLLLIALTWLAGGGCHLLPMTTSLVVIGKIRAERHLHSHQPDFKTQTFKDKAIAVSTHIPVFSLAAVFRLGSLALVFTCLANIPDPVASIYLFHMSLFCYGSLMSLILLMFSRVHQPLENLTVLQVCQELIGKCRLLELEV